MPPIVREAWRRGNVDDVLWRQVDVAIGEVREISWTELDRLDRFPGNGAEARDDASDACSAPMPCRRLFSVSSSVGDEVGRRMEQGLAAAAEPVAQCVQAFLGPRYGGIGRALREP